MVEVIVASLAVILAVAAIAGSLYSKIEKLEKRVDNLKGHIDVDFIPNLSRLETLRVESNTQMEALAKWLCVKWQPPGYTRGQWESIHEPGVKSTTKQRKS